MPFVFADESDTVNVVARDVFVLACVRVGYGAYEQLESGFLRCKRACGIPERAEVKWGRDRTWRMQLLAVLAEHPVEALYYVVDKRQYPKAERRRRKALEAAIYTLGASGPPDPIVIFDARQGRQDRVEAGVLAALRQRGGFRVPPFAHLPSHLVVGLQIADLVAGALRAFEADGDDQAYAVIEPIVRHRGDLSRT